MKYAMWVLVDCEQIVEEHACVGAMLSNSTYYVELWDMRPSHEGQGIWVYVETEDD